MPKWACKHCSCLAVVNARQGCGSWDAFKACCAPPPGHAAVGSTQKANTEVVEAMAL